MEHLDWLDEDNPSVEDAKVFIENHPDLLMGVYDDDGDPQVPLHGAIHVRASDEVILLLLEACPQAAKKIVHGYSALHVAMDVDKDTMCSEKVIKALIDAHPGSLSARSPDTRNLPLHDAVTVNKKASEGIILLLLNAYPQAAAEKMKDGRLLFEIFLERKDAHDLMREICKVRIDGLLPLGFVLTKRSSDDIVLAALKVYPEAAGKRFSTKFDECILPLHIAYEDNHSEPVKNALRRVYPDAEKENPFETTHQLHKFLECEQVLFDHEDDLDDLIEINNKYPEAAGKRGRDGRLPLHIAIDRIASPEVTYQLFQAYRQAGKEKMVDGRLPIEVFAQQKVTDDWPQEYLTQMAKLLLENDMPVSIEDGTPKEHSGSWHICISSSTETATSAVRGVLLEFENISDYDSDDLCGFGKHIHALADARDAKGRTALGLASKESREVIYEYLLFCGQYMLKMGPPEHRTATSVVLRAEDLGEKADYGAIFDDADKDGNEKLNRKQLIAIAASIGLDPGMFLKGSDAEESDESISKGEFVSICKRHLGDGPPEVVIKLMKNKDQWERECNFRKKYDLDPKFVVTAQPNVPSEDVIAKAVERGEGGLTTIVTKYLNDITLGKYAFVMDAADRNLFQFFSQEQPKIDVVRYILRQVFEAVKHLHEQKLMHGDIKMPNIVHFRIDNRLRLIDLDASASIVPPGGEEESFAGAKFSSAILPPEMIEKIETDQVQGFLKYWKVQNDKDLDKKVAPKIYMEQGIVKAHYVVKSFRADEEGKPVEEGLPHKLVHASESIDLWSLGVLAFTLLTGEPLIPSTRDDDCASGVAMHLLHSWGTQPEVLIELSRKITDDAAFDLVWKLLQKEPGKRKKVADLLKSHPFFNQQSADVLERRSAIFENLLFYGRYKFFDGPPEHRSQTSVVFRAQDLDTQADYSAIFDEADKDKNGNLDRQELEKIASSIGLNPELFLRGSDTSKLIFVDVCKRQLGDGPREVVIKLMKNKDQWERECNFRKKYDLDPKFVVTAQPKIPSEDVIAKAVERGEGGLTTIVTKYLNDITLGKYAFVMDAADRNLFQFFSQEQPKIDVVRYILRQVFEAVKHLHEQKLMHGDIKMPNIVHFRIDNRLRLIDLDASASIVPPGGEEESFAGAKFSSAILPPEMIERIEKDQVPGFLKYWEGEHGEDLVTRMTPKIYMDQGIVKSQYVVKSFRTRVDGKPVKEGLPYELVHASESIDVWSLGVLAFTLLTGEPLIPSNREDDCLSGTAMHLLKSWGTQPEVLSDSFKKIQNDAARDLVWKLLQRDPAKRPTVAFLLDKHPFFHSDMSAGTEDQFREMKEYLQNLTLMREICKVRVRVDGLLPLGVVLTKRSSDDMVLAVLEAYPEAAGKRFSTNCDECILPLHIANEDEHSEEVKKALLDAYPCAEKENPFETTHQLHKLLENESSDPVCGDVENLIEEYPEAAGKRGRDGRLPLHIAIDRIASVSVTWRLFQAYPQAGKEKMKDGRLPIEVFAEQKVTDDWPQESLTIMAKLLLGNDMPVSIEDGTPVEHSGSWHACISYSTETATCAVRKVLLDSKERDDDSEDYGCGFGKHIYALTEVRDATGRTALGLASIESRAVIYEYETIYLLHKFLENEPLDQLEEDDVENLIVKYPEALGKRGGDGRLPLHIALEQKLPEEIVLLILNAYPQAAKEKWEDGRLPIEVCLERNMSKDLVLALSCELSDALLHEAIFLYSQKMVKALLDAFPDAAKKIAPTNDLLLHAAINTNASEDIILLILNAYPQAAKEKMKGGRLPIEVCEENDASEDLMLALLEADMPIRIEDGFPAEHSGSWFICIVSPNAYMAGAVRRVLSNEEGGFGVHIHTLAYVCDAEDRSTLGIALSEARAAIYEHLLFCGRYELNIGPPEHRTATSVILRAQDLDDIADYDAIFDKADDNGNGELDQEELKTIAKSNGLNPDLFLKGSKEGESISKGIFVGICKQQLGEGPREVVIKLMQSEDHWKRECNARNYFDLNPKYVVSALSNVPSEDVIAKAVERGEGGLTTIVTKYLNDITLGKYAFVMDAAGRNLHQMFYQEQPKIDAMREILRQVFEAVKHLHGQKLMHGDIKMLNIVRFSLDNGLRLIDLDASARIVPPGGEDEMFAGVKFSSAILPPEMIERIVTKEQLEKFKKYWESENDEDQKKKVAPKIYQEPGMLKAHYVVKSFRTEEGKPVDTGLLPYKLVRASESIDLWSLGVLAFTLFTGETLIPSTRDDDCASGAAMHLLHSWEKQPEVLSELFNKITDDAARDLVMQLLKPKPEERKTVDHFLEKHPFFNKENHEIISQFNERLKDFGESLQSQAKQLEIMHQNILVIKKLSYESKKELLRTRHVLLKGIFEATEVSTPTTFIILNNELPPEPSDVDKEKMLDFVTNEDGSGVSVQTKHASVTFSAEGADLKLEGDLKEHYDRVQDGIKWAKRIRKIGKKVAAGEVGMAFEIIKEEIIKENLVGNEMYLYLIDELTGEPVRAQGWPIVITTPSELVHKLLPLMQVGMRAMSIYNGTAGMARLFGYPVPKVPKEWSKGAQETVQLLKQESSVEEFSVLHEEVKEGSGEKKSVRGESLRIFMDFLEKEDPGRKDGKNGQFAGLQRFGNPEDGSALWTMLTDQADIEDALKKRAKQFEEEEERTQNEHNQHAQDSEETAQLIKAAATAAAKEAACCTIL
ncbi:serine/threonine-protein kinase [Skeletonema marinoi]|uniref:Serine/threonine-protein kinase n=1 Tax=Skeletonema marinoi TaxID=267567 RepID=A0AAD9DIS9_9STRA|nr:serine/threonine-protein kinase [Skeletonema marinoi]